MLASLPPADDLRIEIRPRGGVWWYGTAAQLEAEGLIPDGLVWPTGREDRTWTAGAFYYWLSRQRPEGYKGPRSGWIHMDSWSLSRSFADDSLGVEAYVAGNLYAAEMARREERIRQTIYWERQFLACREAEKDTAYQAFRSIFIPASKKRGRKAGSANV